MRYVMERMRYAHVAMYAPLLYSVIGGNPVSSASTSRSLCFVFFFIAKSEKHLYGNRSNLVGPLETHSCESEYRKQKNRFVFNAAN